MQIFKSKSFAKWMVKEQLADSTLLAAVDEMEQGLIDADLGSYIVKKRVALVGRGKRSGARTLVVYQTKNCAFFVYGFAKNAKENISERELDALRALASVLISYSSVELAVAARAGTLLEVKGNE